MMNALIGLVGVVVGLAIGSSYSFWATRRAELAAAVIATAVLEEELGLMKVSSSAARLAATWSDQRATLVQHLRPVDYQRLAAAFEGLDGVDAASLHALRAVIADLARILWDAHQAFILTPLIDYLKRDKLSKRLNAAMGRSKIKEAGTGSEIREAGTAAPVSLESPVG